MNFFKKLLITNKLQTTSQKENTITEELDNLPFEGDFAKKFITRGGKFIYCTTLKEIKESIEKIFIENQWKTIFCLNEELTKYLPEIDINKNNIKNVPFFTTCEYLIAQDTCVLFSSNQLKGYQLKELPESFIVFSTTSQFVKDKTESLQKIKQKCEYKGYNIPNNISGIQNFDLYSKDDSFENTSNGVAKDLYLLLFEDL